MWTPEEWGGKNTQPDANRADKMRRGFWLAGTLKPRPQQKGRARKEKEHEELSKKKVGPEKETFLPQVPLDQKRAAQERAWF